MASAGAERSGGFTGRTAWARGLAAPLRSYLDTEAGSAVVLLAAAVAAMAWANLPGGSYESVWSTHLSISVGDADVSLTLREWVADGLMSFFFFVVGLEIRRELDLGALRERRRLAVPVVAALGGMACAVGIYLVLNAGGPGAVGWGVAMSTDTAIALGLLALVGRACPHRLRVFMLTLVTVDDIVALAVIAFAYTGHLSVTALAIAFALFAAVVALRGAGVHWGPAYFVLACGIWVALLESGVNPAVAGMALGLTTTAYMPARDPLARAAALAREFREQPTAALARSAQEGVRTAVSPNERLQHLFHPWTSYFVVPLFALANAGVDLGGGLLGRALDSPITQGVFAGYVAGKLAGVSAGAWLATRLRGVRLPVAWPPLVGAAAVSGAGFAVALFIAGLAFGGERLAEAKVGILAAAVGAAALGWLLFRILAHAPDRVRSGTGTDAPILDLDAPVDVGVDHVRGPLDAPVTLVEYGDYECPYCGRAESVVRELLDEFGDSLRYVFRHLPLTDVHPHARMAAEAAEAAGAQGAWWEMHDWLFAHQDALTPAALREHARALGLDVERFAEDVRRRAFAQRVDRDVDSAERDDVTGTPTFFLNGRRHHGAYDEATLAAAVREARAMAGS